MELLHTTVSQGQNGSPVIEGGISLACNCMTNEGVSWSPSSWALHQVKGDPQGSIQVPFVSIQFVLLHLFISMLLNWMVQLVGGAGGIDLHKFRWKY